jgi:preprotein translocase subunit SecD
MRPVEWRLALILGILILSVFLVYPRRQGDYLNIDLDLDLKGGSVFRFRVVTEDAIFSQTEKVAEYLRQELTRSIRREVDGFGGVRIELSHETPDRFVLYDIPPEHVAMAEDFTRDQFRGQWTITPRADGIAATMPDRDQGAIREDAVLQVLDKVKTRIDEFGVSGASVYRVLGTGDEIKVELAGVGNIQRLQSLIQEQARLEWRKVVYPPGSAQIPMMTSEEEVLQLFGGVLPAHAEILVQPADRTRVDRDLYYPVERTSVITGIDLERAEPDTDEYGKWQLSFTLKRDAAHRFRLATREMVDRQMPIVLDRKILTAPVIETEIGAHGRITGQGERDYYTDLALKLRSGALPAKLEVLENRTVGPSLGRDSIRQGLMAAAGGFVVVLIFMLFYYRGSGINAIVALILNLLLVFAALSALRFLFGAGAAATLSLPGIAGLILTIGMAVDANVLVFERIREELRRGRTVRSAIEAGFGKALRTILDANITTMIAAVFLFEFGTGPVQGFAVTLMIGILASMFTAIFVSRTIFDMVLGKRHVERLSI